MTYFDDPSAMEYHNEIINSPVKSKYARSPVQGVSIMNPEQCVSDKSHLNTVHPLSKDSLNFNEKPQLQSPIETELIIHPWFPKKSINEKQIMIISKDQIGYYISGNSSKIIGINFNYFNQNKNKNKNKNEIEILNWKDCFSDSITLYLTIIFKLNKFLLFNNNNNNDNQSKNLINLLFNFYLQNTLILIKIKNLNKKLFLNNFINLSIINYKSIKPFELFTLFSLNNNFKKSKEFSFKTLFPNFLNKIPNLIKLILIKNNLSIYLEKLNFLHYNILKKFKELENCFKFELNVNIKLNGFGSICKKRFGRGCFSYIKTNNNFLKLRFQVSEIIIKLIKENLFKFMCFEIEESIHNFVKCETCSHRLINAYDAVMRNVMGDVKMTI
ncbi:uncharacterized protein I206_107428 [Kwoniella pini CBS 10737]|uniref:Uncharacterized protein n=1 Tax=Kwoniella pini CBS 10737 TaxID=1296096 RepID=A0A1B9HXA9_9TREE|nr:uncharacterized protein I206_05755 [Kwoniella pini CBS 10737]OCF47891.1 hypothetical protein I206_05755 [Kwoniella pini CBS 10737]